jgi:predicted O-methyltransferase YrrM
LQPISLAAPTPAPLTSRSVPILADQVARYLHQLRPERSPVMREMEELAERERIPIVHWETGRFLATLVKALDPELVLEVGTAIGYSTLHMAEALGRGRIVTIERDQARAGQARDFLARAGVGERVEIVEADALEAIDGLDGPFDLIFVDATKTEYARYLELAEPKAAASAALVIDNVLMSGSVAFPDDAEVPDEFGGWWGVEQRRGARALNSDLVSSERWLGAVLPIGDGVAFAARR